jgi:hypothetical protein
MIRFGFQIRTKTGQRIDSISIIAATQHDAERRLRQMYHHCEIIDCREQAVPRRIDTLDIEGVIGLISGAAANMPSMAVPMGRPEGLTFPSGGSERSERAGRFTLVEKTGTL